jgi:hypothetical protein
MEHCSRFQNQQIGEPCYGIALTLGKNCYIKNSTIRADDQIILDKGDKFHSALVPLDHLQAQDEACPGNDRDFVKFGLIGYTLHCNKSYREFDECWRGAPGNSSLTMPPDCWEPPFMGFHHATSLEECLSFCLAVQPLCRAVAYAPGLGLGYTNCWPKNGNPDVATFGPPPEHEGTIHTAVIDEFDRIDESCPKDDHYKTSNNKDFEIHCGQLNTGTNITSLHTQNITACIDACATWEDNNGCVGVVFDVSLAGGYRNCYLQNTTSIIIDQDKRTYAILSGTSIPTSSPTTTALPGIPDERKGSTSKAWVAGPVIGGIALLAIIAFGLFWWRRRKAHVAGAGTARGNPYMGGNPAAGMYLNSAGGSAVQLHGHDHYAGELDGASEYQPMMVKYAYEDAPVPSAVEAPTAESSEPHELASLELSRRATPQELA